MADRTYLAAQLRWGESQLARLGSWLYATTGLDPRLWLLVLAVAAWAWFREGSPSPSAALALSLAAAAYVQTFALYHTTGSGTQRLMVVAQLTYRLAALLALHAGLQILLASRARLQSSST